MPVSPVILWFRQDLRLADNPALIAAVQQGAVLPVYIHDTVHGGQWQPGGASKAWLYRSLTALNQSMGGKLVVRAGDPQQVLDDLISATGAKAVYWNRCYEPFAIKRDEAIKAALKAKGLSVHSFNASLLWEPWQPLKEDGTSYKVFTPFFRKGCLGHSYPREPLPVPAQLDWFDHADKGSLDMLGLLPQKPEPRWDNAVMAEWQAGEKGALARLEAFLDSGLAHYKEGRDLPGKAYVSRLSPHLHFGEISPYTAWHAAKNAALANGWEGNLDKFHAELGWREFSFSLLYHNQDLPKTPIQQRFLDFPWAQADAATVTAWQRGQTGYPIVDAGMRELWQTGYMHNRVRMIVGSFLVKHLLLHWHIGEDWFWDTLFDADLANNSASWQWIAGCGADAAPYFRIFNPVTQGEKFDTDGAYVRRYVPELKHMPDAYLHKPWEAGPLILQGAGVKLGITYPHPVVDHTFARDRAMAAFQSLKMVGELAQA